MFALELAIVSVLSKFQRKGIGGMLIKSADRISRKKNYPINVLLEHAIYYPRFGYVQADKLGIKLPFDIPKENCMVKILRNNEINKISGTVVYSKEFFE
jgi:predicted N-acetyltransferase YhbS